MTIAVLADIHLNSNYPERLENFKKIISDFKYKTKDFIIAGDLFDTGYHGYMDFEKTAKENGALNFYLIPGNHDSSLSSGLFTAENITVFKTPCISFINGIKFLFAPYKENSTARATILEEELKEDDLKGAIAVTHGDLSGCADAESLSEKAYFPFFKNDLDFYGFEAVIMGHIHKPFDLSGKFYYTGSPYPLDINETGKRGIILVDAASGKIKRKEINTDIIYEKINVFIVPSSEEEQKKQIERQIEEQLKKYSNEDLKKITARFFIKGASFNRENCVNALKDAAELKINIENIDSSALYMAEENNFLSGMAGELAEKINALLLKEDEPCPLKQEILFEGLKIIYGIKNEN